MHKISLPLTRPPDREELESSAEEFSGRLGYYRNRVAQPSHGVRTNLLSSRRVLQPTTLCAGTVMISPLGSLHVRAARMGPSPTYTARPTTRTIGDAGE